MDITQGDNFGDLPIDITTGIIDELDVEDIISLELTYNPIYINYVENGGNLIIFP
jgi:hypothetical protein